MNPQLAALACVAFVIYLFWLDHRENRDASAGLWVPLAWMFLAGSRYVSSWLNLGTPLAAESYSEGSPIDRAAFFVLIVAGVVILARRNIDWNALLRKNWLLALYLAYCLVSIGWSEQPFISFKRWIKDLGNPIMVLVVVTTPDPLRSLTLTLRRLSFLLLPLSVVFIKYYPELGREYRVDGSPTFTGVGNQKNDLGLMCLITGIYYFWQIMFDREHFATWSYARRLATYAVIGMIAWLLYMSNSQTSLACLVVAIAVILAWRLPLVRSKPSRLVGLIVAAGVGYISLESAFDIKNQVLALLGRDPSLTNRTELWEILFSIGVSNSAVGVGFMSFWTAERTLTVGKLLGAVVNNAHNGYIEQFLNLGYVGVTFIGFLMLASLISVRGQLSTDPAVAILRLCFLVVAILYNYTEASFHGINNMWTLLLFAVMQAPTRLARVSTVIQQSAGRQHTRLPRSTMRSGAQPGPRMSRRIGLLRSDREQATRRGSGPVDSKWQQ